MTSARRALPRSATNVSIRRDPLEAARASKINLSATLEQTLSRNCLDRRVASGGKRP
jgi:antitoxin CcdA